MKKEKLYLDYRKWKKCNCYNVDTRCIQLLDIIDKGCASIIWKMTMYKENWNSILWNVVYEDDTAELNLFPYIYPVYSTEIEKQ